MFLFKTAFDLKPLFVASGTGPNLEAEYGFLKAFPLKLYANLVRVLASIAFGVLRGAEAQIGDSVRFMSL